MKLIYLRDFDRAKSYYQLNVETMSISKCVSVNHALEVCGFLKRFIWGGSVIFYRDEIAQYVLYQGVMEVLDYRLEVEVKKYIFLDCCNIRIGGIRAALVDLRLLSYISSVLDPIYDDFEDESYDFCGYLKRAALDYPDRYGSN